MPRGVLRPDISPTAVPVSRSPEWGLTAGDDQGTRLQAQQVSHFPSSLSVPHPSEHDHLGKFSWKKGDVSSRLGRACQQGPSRGVWDRVACLELMLTDVCLAKCSTAQGYPNGLLMSS